jgi:hypothetical protein
MSNSSPVGTSTRPVALIIAVQMRVANQRRPQAPTIAAHRLAHATGKAKQSAPVARRNPAAAKAPVSRPRPLVGGGVKGTLGALAQGIRKLDAGRKVTADARKAFRRGEGEIRIEPSHDLSPRGTRHADAAARGLRSGGRGLLSAAYHGVALAGELRKSTREARKAFRRGEGEADIKSSHALSKGGSRHVDAATAGLRRGGLGLLSAAYHGVQALRDARRSAHGVGKPSPATGDGGGPPAHGGPHGPKGPDGAQGKQGGSWAHAIVPMTPMSAEQIKSLPWRAIGQGLQALHTLATAEQGHGGTRSANFASSGGAHTPLAVMLIARGRSVGGAHFGALSDMRSLATIEEHEE